MWLRECRMINTHFKDAYNWSDIFGERKWKLDHTQTPLVNHFDSMSDSLEVQFLFEETEWIIYAVNVLI